jgi:nucleotide-binding universal stress UspA family protein
MSNPRNEFGLRKILVATDLSPRAEKAVARAMQLAEEHNSALIVVHVLSVAAGDKTRTREMAAKIEEDLRRKVHVRSHRNGRSVKIRVLSGTPFVEIIRRARAEEADLVLAGAHGANFMKDLLVGTTVEKIVRKGDRPVLIVKQAARSLYRRVLVAVDFSEESRRALELALRLAPRAESYVLHAYQGFEGRLWRADFTSSEVKKYRYELAKQKREEVKVFLRGIDCAGKPVGHLLRYGRASQVITGVARQRHADLVCVGTVGRTGLPHILLGSVAEHVLRESQCDVLIVRSGSSHFELP